MKERKKSRYIKNILKMETEKKTKKESKMKKEKDGETKRTKKE